MKNKAKLPTKYNIYLICAKRVDTYGVESENTFYTLAKTADGAKLNYEENIDKLNKQERDYIYSKDKTIIRLERQIPVIADRSLNKNMFDDIDYTIYKVSYQYTYYPSVNKSYNNFNNSIDSSFVYILTDNRAKCEKILKKYIKELDEYTNYALKIDGNEYSYVKTEHIIVDSILAVNYNVTGISDYNIVIRNENSNDNFSIFNLYSIDCTILRNPISYFDTKPLYINSTYMILSPDIVGLKNYAYSEINLVPSAKNIYRGVIKANNTCHINPVIVCASDYFGKNIYKVVVEILNENKEFYVLAHSDDSAVIIVRGYLKDIKSIAFENCLVKNVTMTNENVIVRI